MFLKTCILTILFCSFHSAVHIYIIQDYYIRFKTININCTSSADVAPTYIAVSIGDDQLALIYESSTTRECVRIDYNGDKFVCQDECECSPNRKTVSLVYNVTTTNSTLTFKCETSDRVYNTTDIKLAMEPDRNITISSETGIDVNENATIVLECRVNGGYPLANLTWKCIGRDITTTTESEETYIVKKISLKVDRYDNNRECRCEANHFLWGEQIVSRPIMLNVYFAPVKKIILTGIQAGNVTLYESDRLDAICSMNIGNPLPIINFTCGSMEGSRYQNQTSIASVIKANVTKLLDREECICKGNHILFHDELIRRVTLHVYYPPAKPTISFNTTMPFLEGQLVQLTCKSTDKGNPPIEKFEWRKNSHLLATNEEIYHFGKVTKDDNAIEVYCRVINKYTEDRKTHVDSPKTIFNVEYKPRILHVNEILTTEEGKSMHVICTANGNPEPKVHWEFEGDIVGQEMAFESKLNFNKTHRNQHGMYTCFARANSNTHGKLNSSMTIFLTVNYPPDVKVMYDGNNLTEGADVTLVCNASGRPDKYIFSEWIHSYQETVIRRIPPLNKNTLLLSNLSYHDIGRYTCFASNGIRNENSTLEQTGSHNLLITGKAMKIPKDPRIPIFVAEQFKILRANIQFFSNPNITDIQLYNLSLGNEFIPSNGVNKLIEQIQIPYTFYDTEINLTTFAYEASLEICKFQKFQSGFYSWMVSNSEKNVTFTFRITVSGPPEAPRILSYEASKRTINILLEPGFDGGHDQVIHINYSTCNYLNIAQIKLVAAETEMEEINIRNLQPSTTYCLNIYSSNLKGYSTFNGTHCCEHLIIQTDDEVSSETSATVTKIAIGITGTIVGITLIILVVIISIRRRNDRKDGLEDNPLYVSSTNDVVNQDINNRIYTNGKEQDKGKRTIELGCVYENHEDFLERNEQVYANQKTSREEHGPSMNKDGLIYADLDLPPISEQRRFVIHGFDNKNNYADIDLTIKADPLLSSDDDDEEQKKRE